MSTFLLDAALSYASRGWPVFPCSPDTKRPLTESGFKDASLSAARIRIWWETWPDAMIGVPTGAAIGAFVVDLDPKGEANAEQLLGQVVAAVAEIALEAGEGVAGFAAAAEAAIAGATLPPAPMVRTPRGGLHVWFAMPEGIEIGNRAGVIPDVDVRGTGGYVILPPSVRRGPKAVQDGCDGVAYRWEEDAGLDDFAPPQPPPALVRFVVERRRPERESGALQGSGSSRAAAAEADERIRKYGLSALDAELTELARAIKGTRGHTLNKCGFVLGQLVGAGVLSESVVVAGLKDAAARCGLDKVDGWRLVEKNIHRSVGDGMQSPRDLRDVAQLRGSRLGGAPRPPLPDHPGPDASNPAALRMEGEDASRGARMRETGEAAGEGGESIGGGGGGSSEDDRGREILRRCAEEPQNDTGNARRLLAWHGDDIMNVRNVGMHVWLGTHWEQEGGDEAVQRMAQTIQKRIEDEADFMALFPWEEKALAAAKDAERKDPDERGGEDIAAIDAAKSVRIAIGKRRVGRRKFAITCGNTQRINGMIGQAMPHFTIAPDQLDADPLAVNVMNGTLKIAKRPDPDCPDPEAERLAWSIVRQEHDRADRIAKVMPVEYRPDAACPKWLDFMERFQPKPAVRAFLQRFHGYALTGLMGEQVFVYNYGLGANGKSTFMETLARLMGSYAQVLPPEALTGDQQRRGDQATPEFARLTGARLIRCAELPRGQGFRENTLKMLTGGEPMLVRHLHERFFELRHTAKAIGSGNDKPSVGGVDEGIWRRMKLVPWEVTIPLAERRPMERVLADFEKERSGILNWLLEGLLAYLETGLAVPQEIQEATESYRTDMDPVGEFAGACVQRVDGSKVTARSMYQAYVAWCHANSVKPYSEKNFSQLMPQKGFAKSSGRIREYLDVQLHDVPPDPELGGGAQSGGWKEGW